MSRQGGLFGDGNAAPVRYGLEWQHTKSLTLYYYPDTDGNHGYYFERNVWRLLERSTLWKSVQESELEAALWLVAIAREYNEFANYAIDETDEFNVRGVLHNEFHVDEDDLAQHLLEYGNDDVEAFGFPSFDTVSPHDALLDRLVTLRGRIRSLIKETIGAAELRLNFYRDPSGWDSRLRGVALPRLESQEPLKLINDWNEVMRFIERGKKVPPLPPLPDWFDKGWSSILIRGHDKQFAVNTWYLLQQSKLAPKLSGPREEAALWAVMLRLSYVGFLEVAMDEWDDRSILMWLEDFGVAWANVAKHLGAEDYLLDEDTEGLEAELWRAVSARGQLFAAQLEESLPATVQVVDFYCDPFGFRDVLSGGEFPDDDQRDYEERALEPEQPGRLWDWVDQLFISSESLLPE